MSTYASFERHREIAQCHERKVQLLLEESAAALKDSPEETAGFTPTPRRDKGYATKAVRIALAQQRLVVREYVEAARLRPRDQDTKQRLQAARATLRKLQVAIDGPAPTPLRRFLAHFNLSIRYWDLGQAKQAIAEARRACEELKKVGLPLGCAEHNLALMTQVQTEFVAEHRRLQEAVEGSPEAVGPNYDLAIYFFDKRMMLKAEAQLRYTRERARAASALQLVEHEKQKMSQAVSQIDEIISWPTLEGKKARRMAQLLEEIEDDLDFIAALRERWCVEEEAGKREELQETGIRDGARPQFLPCLHRRYSQATQSCDSWCAQLCSSTDFRFQNHSRCKSGFAPPTRK